MCCSLQFDLKSSIEAAAFAVGDVGEDFIAGDCAGVGVRGRIDFIFRVVHGDAICDAVE